MDISIEVRTVINQAKKQVIACKSAEELSSILQQFVYLLDLDINCVKESSQKQPVPSQLISCNIRYSVDIRKEFISRHYSNFCEHILTHGDPSFLKDVKLILTRLFLEGPAESSLLAMVSAIESVVHTEKLNLIVFILDRFASNGNFTELFMTQCLTEGPKVQTQELLTVVTALPDKLANKMKLALNGKFHPNLYYTMLGNEIIKTMNKIHDMACKTRDYSTLFLSNIIGKIALRSSTGILFDILLPQCKEWCYTSPLWSKICSILFLQVPESALDPVIECLLKKVTFYPFLCKILKDSVLSNAVIKHLITHKFILVRYYKDANVLKNIMGYLCADTRRTVLIDVLTTLLTHWSNSNTIKHFAYEQHFYVTEAIILATIQLNSSEISEHKNDLLQKMLSGVQVHLDNPNNKIRQLGMVTAECMTAYLHPESQKLKFDIEPDEDVKHLRTLAALPKFGSDFEKQNFLNTENVVEDGLDKKLNNNTPSLNGSNNEKASLDDHDDEDDLEPYEMSEDDNDLIEGIRPPRYISQCIDGLLASDDPKRHIASLHVLAKVIKSDQDNLQHQCVQLVTILLHLQDKYSLEDYIKLRFSAMVEVTVRCPVQVAGYLTKEFYAQNYSLRQRMDILDVLTAAAGELSKPSPTSEASSRQMGNVVLSRSEDDKGYARDWRTVVQERIDKKTRRFSKKSSVVPPKASVNKFANVAGHFFFPLLQGFDDRRNTFDLLGDDCMVLGLLTCSLGNMMYCAQGLPVAQNMAKSLLEFVWVLRYHNDAYVRQGLLFSLAMVVVSMPAFFLMTEVQNELTECQQWLENVLHNDPSNKCRELALQILVSVRDTFQKHFENNSISS